MKFKLLAAALLFHLCFALSANAQTVHLSVAASMTNAFNKIISGFKAAHPQARLLANFASSGSLAKQIHQGAPCDIYVSANPRWMDFLIETKQIVPGTDQIFAHNRLVFVSAQKHPELSMETLTGLARIALGSPMSVPAGQYAKQAMDKVGIYRSLERANKLIMAKDVRQALLYADQGEVNGAFVYRTDALLATRAVIVFTVPEALHDRVSYPLGLTPAGVKNKTAKQFYDYMGGGQAMGILREFGFEPHS